MEVRALILVCCRIPALVLMDMRVTTAPRISMIVLALRAQIMGHVLSVMIHMHHPSKAILLPQNVSLQPWHERKDVRRSLPQNACMRDHSRWGLQLRQAGLILCGQLDCLLCLKLTGYKFLLKFNEKKKILRPQTEKISGG